MRCPCLSCFDEHMTIFIFLLMINCKHIKESIMKVSVAIVKLKMLFKIFSFTQIMNLKHENDFSCQSVMAVSQYVSYY